MDPEGNTPLMLASHMGHQEVAELLLQAGADRRMKNRFGNTALVLASDGGHAELVRLLSEPDA